MYLRGNRKSQPMNTTLATTCSGGCNTICGSICSTSCAVSCTGWLPKLLLDVLQVFLRQRKYTVELVSAKVGVFWKIASTRIHPFAFIACLYPPCLFLVPLSKIKFYKKPPPHEMAFSFSSNHPPCAMYLRVPATTSTSLKLSPSSLAGKITFP